MKITYTGEAAFSPAQRKKLDVKFSKLSKLLDRGGEISAHVVLTRERHLRRAEIIVNIYDHQIAVNASESEPVQAVTIAADKLEKQILKMRDKWRDTKRRPAAKTKATVEAPATPRVPGKQTKSAAKTAPPADGKRVFRVNHHSKQKPMTM
ncbi:MAG TPA: HPF/RaiA family ribosome-associated protein, partial [Bryobacteraceae bacterium]|nr:HPF/RaiA family ribosome-associated protein [Bryobacteraceae bacterium]